jgi:hypothetical protein
MGLADIPQAAGKVMSHQKYRLLAGILCLVSFAIYVSIPVFTVPGNSFEFFLKTTPVPELAFTFVLSLFMGVLFSMQIYCWDNRIKAAENAGMGFAGFISGAVSAIFASATCASCISAVFSFIGFGGVLFLLEHKNEVTAITAGIVLLSLYFTSERIAGNCSSCVVPQPQDTVKNGKNDKPGK